MAKMCEKVTVPMARASILWLIGEYSDRVSKIAPDILRKMAKSFCDEENVVKLQVLNLAAKLLITNPKQTTLLVQYVLNLAKYDQNYDIRDRARYLRTLLFNNDKCPVFGKHLKKIMLVSKPAPVLQSMYKDSDQFQLSTLSHAISNRVNGYSELPDFPVEAPDPTVRNIELPVEVKNQRRTDVEPLTSKTHKGSSKNKIEKFYSDDDGDDDQSTEGADPTNDEEETDEDEEDKENKSESEDDEEEKSESEESSEEEEDDTENEEKEKTKKITTKPINKQKSESENEDSEEESSEEESESSSEEEVKRPINKPVVSPKANNNTNTEVKKTVKTQAISEESSDSSESSESESEESEPEPVKKNTTKTTTARQSQKLASTTKSNPAPKEISLLDLDFSEPPLSTPSSTSLLTVVNSNSINQQISSSITPILSPALAADLANLSTSASMTFSQQTVQSKKEYELLNKINGNGLQIQYKFTRTQQTSSNKMVNIELIFTNLSNGDFSSFSISNKKLQPGTSMSDLNEFDLAKNGQSNQKLGIDFNDTTQPVQFELTAIYSNDPALGGTSNTKKWSNLSITCPLGELVQPGWSISENEFNKLQAKLKGMNEINAVVDNLSHALYMSKNLNTKMLENFNICQIPSSQQETIKYAALATSSKTQLLLSLYFPNGLNKCHVNVNCEKIVLANMFIKEVKQVLSS
jgi:AP-3 complex subunit beta